MKVICELRGNAVKPKSRLKAVLIVEPWARGISDKRLWQKIITRPVMAIVFGDRLTIKLNMTNPKPIVAITSKMNILKPRLKNIPKFTTVNSRRISQRPLVKRNFLLSEILPFLLKEI